MSKIFSPSVPKATATSALPQRDDDELRRAKVKKIAEMEKTSGATGNQLSEQRLGDYAPAQTRTGASQPSTIVTG